MMKRLITIGLMMGTLVGCAGQAHRTTDGEDYPTSPCACDHRFINHANLPS